MFFLPLLLSGALALGAGATVEKTEFTCNVRSATKGVKGSVQEQFEQLNKKVEQNIADSEAEVQTANNNDVEDNAVDLECPETVSACVCPDLSYERAEKDLKIGAMRADDWECIAA